MRLENENEIISRINNLYGSINSFCEKVREDAHSFEYRIRVRTMDRLSKSTDQLIVEYAATLASPWYLSLAKYNWSAYKAFEEVNSRVSTLEENAQKVPTTIFSVINIILKADGREPLDCYVAGTKQGFGNWDPRGGDIGTTMTLTTINLGAYKLLKGPKVTSHWFNYLNKTDISKLKWDTFYKKFRNGNYSVLNADGTFGPTNISKKAWESRGGSIDGVGKFGNLLDFAGYGIAGFAGFYKEWQSTEGCDTRTRIVNSTIEGTISVGIEVGATKIGSAIGTAIGGPVGTVVGAVVGYGVGKLANVVLESDIGSACVDYIKSGANEMVDFIGDTGAKVWDATKDFAHDTGEALSSLGDAVSDSFDAIGDGVKDLGNRVGDAVSNLGDAVGSGINAIGKGICSFFD